MRQTSGADSRAVWRWALFAFGASLALMGLKWLAYALTHSAAILSDALESLVNVVSSALVMGAIWLSSRPRDQDHPYGHGKVEYFSAGFEGALVSFAAVSIGAIAVWRLMHPAPLERLALGASLQLGTALLTIAISQQLIRAGQRHNSPALEADGVHVRSDAITTLGTFVGVVAVWLTGWLWLDGALALAVAVWLAWSGLGVVRRAVGGLMDEADPALLERIAQALESMRQPGWIAPHHAKVHRLGRGIHIDLHMVFPAYWSLERAHDASVTVERGLGEVFGESTEVMLHMESCTPRSCDACDMPDCPIRHAPLIRRRRWDGAQISAPYRPPPLGQSSDASGEPAPR